MVPMSVVQLSIAAAASKPTVCVTGTACGSYGATVGITDPNEPSGVAPPLANALNGYQQSYVTDFGGESLPSGWNVFTGRPGGDSGAQWGAAHVSVANGVLSLNTYQDPHYNNEWVSGGLCQCGRSQTYGAYFVRSRVTGAGPTSVELLWPLANTWPPEIDFNETTGGNGLTTATVHFTSNNQYDYRQLSINMTQWHTWGVIWSPTKLTYVVDGKVWASVNVPSEIPDIPMTLDLQQQTWCPKKSNCPLSPQSTLVDWAAEYSPQISPVSTDAKPLAIIPIDASLPTSKLSFVVAAAAFTVYRHHAHTVSVNATVASRRRSITATVTSRVQSIEWMLDQDVRNLGASAPRIMVHWSSGATGSHSPFRLLLTVWR